jgi:hypothetical protein
MPADSGPGVKMSEEEGSPVNAIVGVPFEPNHPLRSMSIDEPGPPGQLDNQVSRRLLTIRAADSEGHRSSAHILVNRMYAWRGYASTPLPGGRDPSRITLIATDHDATIGTVTVGFDGADGLLVDELFHDHVAQLRSGGAVLCEFIKLAIDGVVRSNRVLASLFHTAFIYAHEIKGCHKIVIEVNPRHVRFYEIMLGFEVLARERLNRRVNAPAVLMSLDLAYANEQIGKVHRESPGRARAGRSLYHHCFSRDEAAGIVSRLRPRSDA